jgi:hypothetical protein
MKRNTAIAIAALLSGIASASWAQAPGATTTAPVPPPGSAYDNGAIKPGPSIATDPSARDTRMNNQATSPPGSAGPIEGGKSSDAPAALPKANSNGEGGGVQNPNLGSGLNGSSPTE